MYKVVKTSTIKLKTKTKKKTLIELLLDRTLHKKSRLNLCLSIYLKGFKNPFIHFHMSI